jgi:hypothetical protein
MTNLVLPPEAESLRLGNPSLLKQAETSLFERLETER